MVFEGQCDRLIANLHLEELIYHPHYLSVIDGGKPHPTGDTIGDAILRVAWRLAWTHAKPKVADKKFIYGDVDVEDGEFVITFYGDLPQVPDDPGPA